jgi:hypothetical protein
VPDEADVWHAVTKRLDNGSAPSPTVADDRSSPTPEPAKLALPAEHGAQETSAEQVAAVSAPSTSQSAGVGAASAEEVKSPLPEPGAPIGRRGRGFAGLDPRSVWRAPKNPFIIGFLLMAAIATVLIAARVRPGRVLISATGPGGKSLHLGQVIVDEQLRCNGFPCSVSDVAPRDHTIRVVTDEYGSAERVVGVRSGGDHSVDFSLTQPCTAPSGVLPGVAQSAEPAREQESQSVVELQPSQR